MIRFFCQLWRAIYFGVFILSILQLYFTEIDTLHTTRCNLFIIRDSHVFTCSRFLPFVKKKKQQKLLFHSFRIPTLKRRHRKDAAPINTWYLDIKRIVLHKKCFMIDKYCALVENIWRWKCTKLSTISDFFSAFVCSEI